MSLTVIKGISPPRPPCTKWSGAECLDGHHGGTPGPHECIACDHYQGKARGMGDRIERVLKATGIHQAVKKVAPDCGCSQRRTAMNRKE